MQNVLSQTLFEGMPLLKSALLLTNEFSMGSQQISKQFLLRELFLLGQEESKKFLCSHLG